MLDAHAQKEKMYIAVVSGDTDFQAACQRYSSLLYFKTLPRLTELLLSNDARVEKMRLAIQAKTQLIEEAIFDELQTIDFHHRNERFEVHGYDSVDSEGVDVSIVAVAMVNALSLSKQFRVWDSTCGGRKTPTTVLGYSGKM